MPVSAVFYKLNDTPAIVPCCKAFEPNMLRWVPYSFFRLFCTGRTCSPKPEKAPMLMVLGQSTSFNHEHDRGNLILDNGLFNKIHPSLKFEDNNCDVNKLWIVNFRQI